MGNEYFSTGVDAREQLAVALIRSLQAEADDGERSRRAQLPTRFLGDPPLEHRRQPNAATDVLLETAASVAAKHGPQLQRPEAPPQGRSILGQRQCILGIRGAQVLGDQAERSAELLRP